jgi:chloride channel protein, CIC family
MTGPRRGGAYLRLIGLGALIGIPAALLASVFLALVHLIEDLLWQDLPRLLGSEAPPWYLVVGLPVVGAAIVFVARRFLPGDGGHPPIEGIGGGATPWRHAFGIALAAVGTLAFGAVLGPEAPLIALGSAVGMALLAIVKVKPRQEQVIATAGSFSAVSALFGGPLVAGMLLLEGGIAAGPALIPTLLPGLVAAAVGYLLFVGLGDWGGLASTPMSVPGLPPYSHEHIPDLLLAIAVGVLAVAVISPVRRFATQLQRRTHSADTSRPAPLWPLLAGGLIVGLLAEAARLLGADSQDVLFSGQAGVPALVAETSTHVVLVLLFAKALGYMVSLGCGFRGGPVFPAIFIGIAVAMLPVIWFDVSPTWAVAVGAAAGMTAGTGLVFSSLLFSMLLVGQNGLHAIPAAVFAVAAAWIARQAIADPVESAATEERAPTESP